MDFSTVVQEHDGADAGDLAAAVDSYGDWGNQRGGAIGAAGNWENEGADDGSAAVWDRKCGRELFVGEVHKVGIGWDCDWDDHRGHGSLRDLDAVVCDEGVARGAGRTEGRRDGSGYAGSLI